MLFRWAMGDVDTSTLLPLTGDKQKKVVRMAKMSILSFQLHFPLQRFCVFYNGKNFDLFCSVFEKTCPALPCEVELYNARDFETGYHFEPPSGVWWKWVPFRFDIEDTEISVDTDIICLSRPKNLVDCIQQSEGLVVIDDFAEQMGEWVVGNLWEQFREELEGKFPVNSGLLVMKPGVSFLRDFLAATTHTSPDQKWWEQHGRLHRMVGSGSHAFAAPGEQYQCNTHFIDEQGCINLGIHRSGEPFVALDREVNVYGLELFEHLERGVEVETVHFLAGTKQLFWELEPYLFRKFYDQAYSFSELVSDVRSLKSSLVRPEDSALFGLPVADASMSAY
jgi:hypothetical protein